MKGFLSFLLVAMLLVGCMSTAAFAATTADRTTEVTLSVSGNCATYQFQILADAPVEITNITGSSGLMINKANGMVAYLGDGQTNIDVAASVTVTVKLPAGSECGDYSVYATGNNAYSVKLDDEGNVVAGELIPAAISVSGGSASFSHENDGWENDETNHWHVCKHCDETYGNAAHQLQDKADDAWTWKECECGYATEKQAKPTEPKPTDPQPTDPTPTEPKPTEPSNSGKDEVADTGDATPYGLFNSMIAVVVLAMVSTVVFVFKRKTAK